MSRAPYRRGDKPSYTATQVKAWYDIMREHKYTLNKLAKHLGLGFTTVQTYLAKYDAGQLK